MCSIESGKVDAYNPPELSVVLYMRACSVALLLHFGLDPYFGLANSDTADLGGDAGLRRLV